MNKELKQYLYMLVGKELTRENYEKILSYFNDLKQQRDHYKNKTIDNLYMKNIGGEKVFCLENDKETFRDMIFELQERINKAIEFLKENACYDYGDFSRDLIYYDCRKLLDILKGSDEYEKEEN